MSTTPKTVDEILQKMFNSIRPDISLPKAKQHLYQLMLDVIGEDEDALKTLTSAAINIATGRNKLRDEQRTKLKQVFGVSDE